MYRTPPKHMSTMETRSKAKAKAVEGCSQHSRRSRSSASSSATARIARAKLEAAEQKARIEMDLIDKRLAVDIAEIESVHTHISNDTENIGNHSIVEEWMQANNIEPETQCATNGLLGVPCPPTDVGADYGRVQNCNEDNQTTKPLGPSHVTHTVRILAGAIKDLTSNSSTNRLNASFLSRLCTPKDLPIFSGDPMEYLLFKEAYTESNKVCQFSDPEKLSRLRKCLKGKAYEAVTALLIGATSPKEVMDTLELQFGNPDKILHCITQDVKKLHPLSQEYHKDIVCFSVKVRNYVAAVNAIGRNEYLLAADVITIVLSKLPSVILSKWTDYTYPLVKEGKRPTLLTLTEFLNVEAVKANSISLINTRSAQSDYDKRKFTEPTSKRSHTVLTNNDERVQGNHCKFCRTTQHQLTDCKKFLKALCRNRWAFAKRNRLCFKCLLHKHGRETCSADVCDMDNCGLPHHRLLHYKRSESTAEDERVQGLAAISEGQNPEQEKQIENVTHINNSKSDCKVLLKVVRVNLHGPNGKNISAYALLDDGSTVSLVSAALTSRLGLRGRRGTIRVCGAWDSNELVCETDMVCLKMSTCDGNKNYELNVRSVKELNLPEQCLYPVDCNKYEHLKHLNFHACDEYVKPEILIGQDYCNLLLPLEIRAGKINEPCATLTSLGWCVHGRVPSMSSSTRHSALLLREGIQGSQNNNEAMLQELHDEVRKSFTIDSLGISGKPRQNAEDLRALERLEQTAILIKDRWHVGLPWRDTNCILPDSKPTALNRLRGLEKKMKANEEYAQRYRARVQHLFDNDFAAEVSDDTVTSKTWYLSHFGVDNPNKRKLRLVFDAAAKAKGNDLSLNDYLLKGPDLLTSLFGIMMRFREHKSAIAGDIRDMFLRVKILPEDQDAFRFLWRDDLNPNSPVKIFRMTSLIFGANCSPFIAQFVKNKNADRFLTTMPGAVEAVRKQHYMDDYMNSHPNDLSCIKLAHEVSEIHKAGGFVICNWLSNSKQVLNSLPEDLLAPNSHRFKIGEHLGGERALGLIWYPEEDTLGIDFSFKKIAPEIVDGRRPTKREALKLIMSIFDVYGILTPITIIGKMILQSTWKSSMEWDAAINDDIYERWMKWLTVLKSLAPRVRIPRCYQTPLLGSQSIDNSDNYRDLQLHIFSDASTQAMCCVGYWRWISNNEIKVAFVSGKSRVAPVKPVTVPRLELQAALMGARLASSIQTEHRIKATRRVFWCDSTTVLQWLRNNKRDYQIFVANRLGEIDELTKISEWRYVPTRLNVADIGTRETYNMTVFEKEWLSGPQFLYGGEKFWPEDLGISETSIEETSNREIVSTIQTTEHKMNLPVPEPSRFSSWLRLLRSTEVVLNFIQKCKRNIFCPIGDSLQQSCAENLLIRYSQAQSFNDEISRLKENRCLKKDSKLFSLSPFLDKHGVVRISGRIDAADGISAEVKQPAILDGKDHITRLIVRRYHEMAGHGNREMVVNELKQRYWIIGIRPTVKFVASRCMYCRIRKAIPEIPRMGDLPAGRMAHHFRPFTHCGVDLFGPIEVTIGRRREKRYGVLFTCMTVRAVHVEVVASLSTDSLLMAIRRMASRRGWPEFIYSDNGTNFRGADAELRKSLEELDQSSLEAATGNYNTKWTFIPPASPHWGGAWERLIGSVKTSLKVILKERAPREEVLNTLLAEVENIVNSRPLGHVSVEPGSMETLTPNHFLIGTSSNMPMLGIYNDSDLHLRKLWRKSQALADMFWKRWVKEILPQMLTRSKWHGDPKIPLAIGDVVLVADPSAPRNTWPKGIIEEVFPGQDGRVRVVAVRTAAGTHKRSAGRVVRLPLED